MGTQLGQIETDARDVKSEQEDAARERENAAASLASASQAVAQAQAQVSSLPEDADEGQINAAMSALSAARDAELAASQELREAEIREERVEEKRRETIARAQQYAQRAQQTAMQAKQAADGARYGVSKISELVELATTNASRAEAVIALLGGSSDGTVAAAAAGSAALGNAYLLGARNAFRRALNGSVSGPGDPSDAERSDALKLVAGGYAFEIKGIAKSGITNQADTSRIMGMMRSGLDSVRSDNRPPLNPPAGFNSAKGPDQVGNFVGNALAIMNVQAGEMRTPQGRVVATANINDVSSRIREMSPEHAEATLAALTSEYYRSEQLAAYYLDNLTDPQALLMVQEDRDRNRRIMKTLSERLSSQMKTPDRARNVESVIMPEQLDAFSSVALEIIGGDPVKVRKLGRETASAAATSEKTIASIREMSTSEARALLKELKKEYSSFKASADFWMTSDDEQLKREISRIQEENENTFQRLAFALAKQQLPTGKVSGPLSGMHVGGGDAAYLDRLSEVSNVLPQPLAGVFEKNSRYLYLVDTNSVKPVEGGNGTRFVQNAFYNPLQDACRVSARHDMANPRGAGSTAFHELGHGLDFVLGRGASGSGPISMQYGLGDEVKKDFALAVDRIRMDNPLLSDDRVMERLEKEFSASQEMITGSHVVTDLFGGLCDNKCVPAGGYQHDEGYYSGPGGEIRLSTEAFANLVSVCSMGNPRHLQVTSKYLPNTIKRFKQIMSDAQA